MKVLNENSEVNFYIGGVKLIAETWYKVYAMEWDEWISPSTDQYEDIEFIDPERIKTPKGPKIE